MILLLLAGCADSGTSAPHATPNEQPVTPAPMTKEQMRAAIAEGVFDPYTRDFYPKLYAKLGKPDPTKRIQALREAAAFSAMESGRCDRVELAEVSDARMTKANLSVFVDCRNGERFYLSESDVEANAKAVANSDKTLPRAAALAACVDAARSIATHPALLDPHVWTGASYDTNRTMGAARVRLDFDAMNSFGVKVPYTADCLFPAGASAPELTVTAR